MLQRDSTTMNRNETLVASLNKKHTLIQNLQIQHQDDDDELPDLRHIQLAVTPP